MRLSHFELAMLAVGAKHVADAAAAPHDEIEARIDAECAATLRRVARRLERANRARDAGSSSE